MIGNYWGGGSPEFRISPLGSVLFDPYETSVVSAACEIVEIPESNLDIPQQYLLLGSASIDKGHGNFTEALNKYRLLADNYQDTLNPILPLSQMLYVTGIAGEDASELKTYYNGLKAEYSGNGAVLRSLSQLSAEASILQELYEQAISEYSLVIDTSSDESEIFYAQIDRARAVSLLLDSLYEYYQNWSGDNIPVNLQMGKML